LDQKSPGIPPYANVDESEGLRPAAPLDPPLTFSEIFQQHSQFLWRTLMNLGVPRCDAQDVCQDVMLTVHRRLPDFDGRSLRGWLYGICVRFASDYRRSARVRREVTTDTLPERAGASELTEQLDRARSLRQTLAALDALDDAKREAFVLYEVEELTLAEVSEALQVPIQTVYSRVKAARDVLREKLGASRAAEKGAVREAG